MHREIQTKVVPLTLATCKQFASMVEWKGERLLKKSRVDSLRREFEKGHFYSPTWSTVKVGNRVYRMDGQHSSNMLASIPPDNFPKGLHVFLREFQADSIADLPKLFGDFDRSSSSRTMKERVKACAAIYGDISEIGLDYVVRGTGAISYSKNGGTQSPFEDREAILSDPYNRKFVVWMHSVTTDKIIWRVPVVAAFFDMWNVDQSDAGIFLSQVASVSETNKQPAMKLREFLRTNTSAGGCSTKMGAPPRMFYVKSIHAWNAWRNGQTTELKYFASSDLPKPW